LRAGLTKGDFETMARKKEHKKEDKKKESKKKM
jgi:hypothetical protein